jgi:hypothetical protein
MTDDQTKALLRLADTLERGARQLRELARGAADQLPQRKPSSLPQGFIEGLRATERSLAAQQIATLSHAQLGEAFVQLGGVSRDKKRSKDWLVERILWYLFDFQAGHDIIRGSK